MVELKKKVTLRSKTAEAPVEETPRAQSTSTSGSEEPKSKGKWYAAALAGLLVLVAGGYYLSQQGDDTAAPVVEVVEQPKSDNATAKNTDGTTHDGQNQDGATADNGATAAPDNNASKGGTPANVDQNQNGVAPAQTNNAPVVNSEVPRKKNTETVANTVKQNTAPAVSASGAVEEVAKEVIRGKYGNGDVRKRYLGDRYTEIQSKVNEMYKNGLFH